VREVARLVRFTPVPGTPAFVVGVANLRGEILALFDLRQLLGVVAEGVTDLGRIVVLGETRCEFGFLADAASEILYVPRASLARTETAWVRPYVLGLSADGVVILSGEALLNDPRLTMDPTPQ
jgi:purine-binding chemotaxis protein CheW